jgi:hypothetical protein
MPKLIIYEFSIGLIRNEEQLPGKYVTIATIDEGHPDRIKWQVITGGRVFNDLLISIHQQFVIGYLLWIADIDGCSCRIKTSQVN